MGINTTVEGYHVVRNMWNKYYDEGQKRFIAKESCSGCIGNKFNVWSVSVAVQAVVDGCRIYPELMPLLDPAVNALSYYRSPEYHGYCAAENFGGNKDIYYDDDAQVASAIITAYEVSGNKKYLDLGRDLVRFLMGGYVEDKSKKCGGGMLWHIEKDYVNACTTAECALAALRIAKFIPNELKEYIEYAKKCIRWQLKVLQDKGDKCIKDGLSMNSDKPSDMKWTYNTGTTLSATAMLYAVEPTDEWLNASNDLAKCACNHNSPFFDRDYPDDKRYWRDPSYFVQLIVEGLADYHLYVGQKAPKDLIDKLASEIARHLAYFKEYMFDSKDGLYYQMFQIQQINEEVYKKYKEHFGGHKGYGPNKEERGKDNKCVKTLIGSGSAARIWFQGGRVVPQIG